MSDTGSLRQVLGSIFAAWRLHLAAALVDLIALLLGVGALAGALALGGQLALAISDDNLALVVMAGLALVGAVCMGLPAPAVDHGWIVVRLAQWRREPLDGEVARAALAAARASIGLGGPALKRALLGGLALWGGAALSLTAALLGGGGDVVGLIVVLGGLPVVAWAAIWQLRGLSDRALQWELLARIIRDRDRARHVVAGLNPGGGWTDDRPSVGRMVLTVALCLAPPLGPALARGLSREAAAGTLLAVGDLAVGDLAVGDLAPSALCTAERWPGQPALVDLWRRWWRVSVALTAALFVVLLAVSLAILLLGWLLSQDRVLASTRLLVGGVLVVLLVASAASWVLRELLSMGPRLGTSVAWAPVWRRLLRGLPVGVFSGGFSLLVTLLGLVTVLGLPVVVILALGELPGPLEHIVVLGLLPLALLPVLRKHQLSVRAAVVKRAEGLDGHRARGRAALLRAHEPLAGGRREVAAAFVSVVGLCCLPVVGLALARAYLWERAEAWYAMVSQASAGGQGEDAAAQATPRGRRRERPPL